MSSPTRWARLKELFQRALDRPKTERGDFVASATEDTDLRCDVASLLRAHEEAGSFIERPAVVEPAADPALQPGQRIGPYRVLSELGHGGMGDVYRAVRDDDSFRMEVAVKVVRGGLASEYHRERFRQERQLLARLEHPNVARLLDGGTTEDGRQYFVMELVRGEPIDVYCERHALPLRQRLALFLEVCGAVHDAHQKLIVHRDLKPENILVTAEGTPKLLDFGIAKLLEPDAGDATVTQVRALTPSYASPEQIKGEPVTTASDVYSLGVLLYELLCGRRPLTLTGLSYQELLRVVCEREPEPPSLAARGTQAANAPTLDVRAVTLLDVRSRELRGDLDAIVMVALRKEPSRRYGSVLEMSEDLGRYLNGMPIRARADTLRYRIGKFLGRNRAAVIAALLVAAALLAGFATTLREWRRAEAERQRAERRFQEVRRTAGALVFEVHDQVARLPGATRARERIVRLALAHLDGLAREAAGDAGLQRELAAAYERFGDVQGTPGQAHLGDSARALASHQRALELREALLASGCGDRCELAGSLLKVGDLLRISGRRQEALVRYRRALEVVGTADAASRRVRRQKAAALERVGRSLLEGMDTPGALASLQAAVELYEALRREADEPALVHELTVAWAGLGPALLQVGRPRDAIQGCRRLMPAVEAAAAREPTNAQAARDVSVLLELQGNALRETADVDGALDAFRRALAVDERRAQADAADSEAQRDVAVDLLKIGRVLLTKGDGAGALAALSRSLALSERRRALDPGGRQVLRDLAIGHYWIAQAQLARGKLAAARREMGATLELQRAIAAADPQSDDARDDVADASVGLADILTRSGDERSAIALLVPARLVRQELLAKDPTNGDRRLLLASVDKALGDAWAARARRAAGAEAESRWLEARGGYAQALGAARELQGKGLLGAADAASLPELEAELAACDRALAGLRAAGARVAAARALQARER